MFFDAHVHNIGNELGGFLIGLEGKPLFENVLDNDAVLNFCKDNKQYIPFVYVEKSQIKHKNQKYKYVKFHPRRERYSPTEVFYYILCNHPTCVMIDTLNEPYWLPYDYWKLAIAFSDIFFIFPHSGGYLINDFIKICHFQKNVWIDFALTHSILGHYGNSTSGLPYVNQAINYALESPFKSRILFSTDFPFFSQHETFEFYKYQNKIDLLNDNFMALFNKLRGM